MVRLLAWAVLAAVVFAATGFAAASVVEAIGDQLRGRSHVTRRLALLVGVWAGLFVLAMGALTGTLTELLAVIALVLTVAATRPVQRLVRAHRTGRALASPYTPVEAYRLADAGATLDQVRAAAYDHAARTLATAEDLAAGLLVRCDQGHLHDAEAARLLAGRPHAGVSRVSLGQRQVSPPPFSPDPDLIADRRLRRQVQRIAPANDPSTFPPPPCHLALPGGQVACDAAPGQRWSTTSPDGVTCPDCRYLMAADGDGLTHAGDATTGRTLCGRDVDDRWLTIDARALDCPGCRQALLGP